MIVRNYHIIPELIHIYVVATKINGSEKTKSSVGWNRKDVSKVHLIHSYLLFKAPLDLQHVNIKYVLGLYWLKCYFIQLLLVVNVII